MNEGPGRRVIGANNQYILGGMWVNTTGLSQQFLDAHADLLQDAVTDLNNGLACNIAGMDSSGSPDWYAQGVAARRASAMRQWLYDNSNANDSQLNTTDAIIQPDSNDQDPSVWQGVRMAMSPAGRFVDPFDSSVDS
jgi:hypothetical protein